MYHSRFMKNHYDAGHRWGALLYKNGIDLEKNISFAYDEKRKAFVNDCIPIYQKYYPEILEEINGICDGAHLSKDVVYTFLLGMYCFTMDNHCTCMACRDDKHMLFGRNSDFLVSLEKQYDSCYYCYDGYIPFIGNTTAFTQMEDGMNAHGLAVGLTFICPTPSVRKPGLHAGMLVRYILEHCKSVKEAITFIKNVPIGSAQTITMMDANGEMLIVECNPEKVIEIYPTCQQNPFVTTANCFTSDEMQKYQPKNIDDWRSHERYETAQCALSNVDTYSFDFIKDILSGKYGFMCQYDRRTNADTVWSCIYDIKNKKIYRCEGNPSRKRFVEDKRLTFI